MAKAWRPELSTAEQVITYYENSPFTMFRVYAGTEPIAPALRYEYLGTEKSEGLHELTLATQAILANRLNINTYLLQLVKSEKMIALDAKGKKTVHDAINITFQLNYPDYGMPVANGQTVGNMQPNNEMMQLLKQIAENQNKLSERVAQLEAEDLEDEDEDDEPMNGLNLIGNLLNNPQMQNLLLNALTGLLTKTNTKPAAMAGIVPPPVNEDKQYDKCNDAIDILIKYDQNIGDSLLKLAAIAENNPSQFSMLLSMLNKM